MMHGENKVYVVDDDAGARTSLSTLLHEYNFSVEAFDSAEKFLSIFNGNMPGCIVLDIQMPGMSGLELQEKLLCQNVFTPIIFVTGYGTVSWAVQAIKKGAVNFLEKPYDEKVLLDNINSAFEQDAVSRRLNINCAEVNKNFQSLTKREKEVIEYLVFTKDGATNKMIAKTMGISHRTVEEYRSVAMNKMQANSLNELITMLIVCRINYK